VCEQSGAKPLCAMKVNAFGLRWDSSDAPSTDHDPLVKDLSMSIYVGTRKMVNYA
jgi:hypothetical protein